MFYPIKTEIKVKKMIQEIKMGDYIKKRLESDLLIDLRDKLMYEFGTIPGAINIPIDSIKQLYQLPKDRNIYVFCQKGEISGEIVELLSDAGYNAWNLIGGYRAYLRCQMAEQAGSDTEK